MKTSLLLLFLILFSNFINCYNPEQNLSKIDANLPFVLEKEFELGGPFFLPVDIDRDGKDEFLDIAKREKIAYSMRLYREPDVLPIFQVNFPKGKVTNRPLAYWTKNEELRILVPLSLDNKAYLCIYSGKGDSLGHFEITNGVDRNNNGFWDGHIKPVAVEDFNEDGTLDVLIIMSTPYDLHPRGVCVFDLKNSKQLWEFQTGAWISEAIIVDLTEDGETEIILGTSAMDNGSISNGTNDSLSYLIILKKNGEKGKLIEMGDKFSTCLIEVADVTGDGKPELITSRGFSHLDKVNQSSLIIWEGAALSKRREITADYYGGKMKAKDINNDGKEEIIVASELENRVVVYGVDLEPISETPITIHPTNLIVEDLDADGSYEIIVSGKKSTIVYNCYV